MLFRRQPEQLCTAQTQTARKHSVKTVGVCAFGVGSFVPSETPAELLTHLKHAPHGLHVLGWIIVLGLGQSQARKQKQAQKDGCFHGGGLRFRL